jgi:hypothetical protein
MGSSREMELPPRVQRSSARVLDLRSAGDGRPPCARFAVAGAQRHRCGTPHAATPRGSRQVGRRREEPRCAEVRNWMASCRATPAESARWMASCRATPQGLLGDWTALGRRGARRRATGSTSSATSHAVAGTAMPPEPLALVPVRRELAPGLTNALACRAAAHRWVSVGSVDFCLHVSSIQIRECGHPAQSAVVAPADSSENTFRHADDSHAIRVLQTRAVWRLRSRKNAW